MKDYVATLQYVFAKIYGDKPENWTAGDETANAQGQAVTDFRDEAKGITLHVTDTGKDAEGSEQFTAKRTDAAAAPDESINLAIGRQRHNARI